MSLQRLCVKPGTLRHVRTPAKYLSSIKCIFNNKRTISIGTRLMEHGMPSRRKYFFVRRKQSYIFMINLESDKQSKRQSMNNQRGFLRLFFVLTLFGVMNFLAIISSPAWANIRGVDIWRLIGTGMCFGGAIFSFGAYFHGRRFFKD
jgi:hypothetical protein